MFQKALLLSALVALTIAAPSRGDTLGWFGTLTDQPDVVDAALGGCPAGTRLQQSYDLTMFDVDTSGVYVIETTKADGMPGVADDTLLALYEGTFEGSWPVNCLDVNDDANGGALSSLTESLTAGQTYVALVTYAWQTGADGVGAIYGAQISGPGAIRFIVVFRDGFESGDTSAWSLEVP